MILLFLSVIFVFAALCITAQPVKYDASVVNITEKGEDTQGYIKTSSGRIWFKIAGINSKKTPLLLLNGGPGVSHDYFEPLLVLSDERPVIFYDPLGCGNSDKPGDMSQYSVESYVKEVGEVRSALGLSDVHILGQSWGGGLAAAYFISEKPGGVKSMILSSPLLDTKRWISDQKSYLSEMPENIQEIVRIAEETGVYDSEDYQDAMNEYYSLHLCRLDPWPPLVIDSLEKLSISVYMHMWGPSEFTCTGTLQSFNLTANLSDIGVPVLFICGEYDEATPSAISHFAGFVDNSQILIIKNASHLNHIEKTDEYVKAVREFLGDLD